MLRDNAILLLAIGQTLVWAGAFYLFPASLVRWEAALGWSKAELTLGITIAVLASAVAAPFAGRLIDRGHGAAQMAGATALAGLCVIGVSQVAHLWQFYLLWLGIGACFAGCLYEPCFAMITRARGTKAKSAIIWVTLVAGFAGTVSFPTVHLLAEAFGWRMGTALIGAFVALIVAPLLWAGAKALGETAGPAEGMAQPDYGFLRQPVYWLLGLGFALSAIVHGASLHHFLPLLAERGVTDATAVVLAACIGPMQIVGRLGMVATQHRLSTHAFALIAFVCMGGSVLALLVAGGSVAIIALFILLFGSAYGTVSILRPVIARDFMGEADFGAKSGGLAAMYQAASALSAFLGALLWSLGGYAMMLACLVVLAGCGAVLYIAAHRLSLRQAARGSDGVKP
ncbi:putative membrane protein [Candidatus Rhodobacter oscarellae]|uniref:Putative membrane protein n=1 Tax=Candidatus Rhodobacter oscarellae TaxID=1675527 RepID=A0A0J9EAX8_9RHOB|nr:MFS transporter [Candidatus Rhodobacter lobularis]KMW58829.1 putative membrane protein [Candidatus Rhodobacter lobularis]